MRAYEQILGKVSITPEGDWENKEYNRLSLVRYPSTGKVYLSKKNVPADVEITNTEYWMFVFESLTREELDYILSHFASFVVVSELPQTGDGRKIYLVGPIGAGSDRYEEYIYTEGSWIKIGDTSIDLTEYAKKIDVPVEKGIGTNSVQQKRTGAVAISESSIAIGVDSFAGQRGYKYTNTGNVTNQLTLTSVDGLAVGDVVSIVNKSKYPDCSTITEINGNTITFDSLPFNDIVPDLTDFDDYLIYVSEKPNVGDVELAIAAHAEGVGTKAQNYTAHAEGRDTQALGEYSHAEGRDTVAQYAAHAEGRGTEANGEESHSEGINTKALGKHAHAEGDITEATNYNAHAEGYFSKAYGNSSHAEGGKWVKGATGATRINGGTANGDGSHAEGGKTVSKGNFSHAEGYSTIANESNSHVEGQNSRTGGETRPSLGGTSGSQNSHAEGSGTWANGLGAHSEGGHTVASGNYSHAEGYETQAGGLTKLGPNSHTEGFKTSTGDTTLFDTTSANANTTPGAHAHAEGNVTVAMGRGSHAEGEKTKAEGIASHAEGVNTTANGKASHAEGNHTIAKGIASHAEGVEYNEIATSAEADAAHAEGAGVVVKGQAAHGEGLLNVAGRTQEAAVAALADFPNLSGTTEQKVSKLIGFASHSEGSSTQALGTSSHAEGNSTQALVNATHAEGDSTTASGEAAHSEGYNTLSSGNQAHAEGYNTEATANQSHAEGKHTKATSQNAHAEGNYTTANGNASHTEGYYTVANNSVEHAEGQYNVSIADVTRHTVGIGNSSTRKNAHTITADGKHYIPGVGGYTGEENTVALLNSRQDLATVINSKVEGVFIANEGSTSFSDIKTAIDAGREVLCNSAAGYAYLIEKTNSYITFASLPSNGHNGLSRRLTVDNNNNWTTSYVGFDLLYDTTNKKLKKNYGGSTYDDIVTAEKIVEDGRITVELSPILQSDMPFINGSGNSFSRTYTEADFTAIIGSNIAYALKTDTQGAKNVYFIITSAGIGGYVTHGLRYNTNYYWELIYFDVDRTKHISIKLVYDSTNLEWTISGEVLTW